MVDAGEARLPGLVMRIAKRQPGEPQRKREPAIGGPSLA